MSACIAWFLTLPARNAGKGILTEEQAEHDRTHHRQQRPLEATRRLCGTPSEEGDNENKKISTIAWLQFQPATALVPEILPVSLLIFGQPPRAAAPRNPAKRGFLQSAYRRPAAFRAILSNRRAG